MTFFLWTIGAPIALVAVAVAYAFVSGGSSEVIVGAAVVAFVWFGVTARMRRTYWGARVRARAAADSRRARSRRA